MHTTKQRQRGLIAGLCWLSLLLPCAGAAAPEEVSPARRIDRGAGGTPIASPPRGDGFRTIDGSDNNTSAPETGAADTLLVRLFPADYADGVSTLAGAGRPSARAISNDVNAQAEDRPNTLGASDFLWQWGQFVDHDLDLTDGADPAEPAPIAVPTGDPYFDPTGTGTEEIALNRSLWHGSTGTDTTNPREQVNEISAWIDASNVYGSDDVRAAALRTRDGTGQLKTSAGNLLPFNTGGLPNAGGSGATLFLAGDVRANEQLGLTAMHTLFVREHNRIAANLAARHPEWSGDLLYEKARQRVGAEMQVITYREYLPALLGRGAIARYRGYDPGVDPSISNAFATAAYRYGHSALSTTLLRVDGNGEEIPAGHLALRDAFFAPGLLSEEDDIDPILRGLATQTCQRIDPDVIDDVRNFLFGPPGSGGFDLPSLNIQRGRDHGLPSYNDVRESLGFGRAASFAEVNPDIEIQDRLASAYASVDDIDLWEGGLAEPALKGGHLGPVFASIVIDQFEAVRDGDRFWYTRVLSAREIRAVEQIRLSDVIRLNTDIGDELQRDVFRVQGARDRLRQGVRRTRRR